MWAQVLPKLKIHADIELRGAATTGRAIRKDSPKLAAALNDFYVNWAKKQGVIAYRNQQYTKRVKEFKDPTQTADFRRFQETIALFEKYGSQYGFGPLMTKYFPDAKFTDVNRQLFAFASYNCGPGNISKMRKEAASRGLDPDKWFNNVEIVTAERIGIETTTYVRNIYKYYVSYKLKVDARAEREAQTTGRSGEELINRSISPT